MNFKIDRFIKLKFYCLLTNRKICSTNSSASGFFQISLLDGFCNIIYSSIWTTYYLYSYTISSFDLNFWLISKVTLCNADWRSYTPFLQQFYFDKKVRNRKMVWDFFCYIQTCAFVLSQLRISIKICLYLTHFFVVKYD